MGKKIEVSVGDIYGQLTITGEIDPYTSPVSGQVRRRVSYLCSCGVDGEVLLNSIRRGNTKSCGCLKAGNARKHGGCGTQLYGVYRGMLNRCNNPKDKRYVGYGSRGIKVCEDWSRGFEDFYTWTLESDYEEGLSIERVDVNGDYTPSNCTWIPLAEQALNRRIRKDNSSGITGVSYIAKERRWVARWEVGGKVKSKSFSVKKYGYVEAKQMAIDKRLEIEELLGITNNDGT